jgi:(2Fe-2S) ferredoxin
MSNEHDHCVAQDYEDTPVKTLGKLRYHLFICTDGKDCQCDASGSGELLAAIRGELAKRRLLAAVKMTIMQCRQPGLAGPLLVVHPDNVWYSGLSAGHAVRFVDEQIVKGEPWTPFVLPPAALKPVTAVPPHVVESGDCCPAPAGSPEDRVAAAR